MTYDWGKDFARKLEGRTITKVRPLSDAEMDAFGLDAGYGDMPLMIILDDDSFFVPLSDPEGNGFGFLDVYPAPTRTGRKK